MVKGGQTDLRNDGPKKVKRTPLGAPLFDEKAKIGQSIQAETLGSFHQTCRVRPSSDMTVYVLKKKFFFFLTKSETWKVGVPGPQKTTESTESTEWTRKSNPG
jgi:hypothetical protein